MQPQPMRTPELSNESVPVKPRSLRPRERRILEDQVEAVLAQNPEIQRLAQQRREYRADHRRASIGVAKKEAKLTRLLRDLERLCFDMRRCTSDMHIADLGVSEVDARREVLRDRVMQKLRAERGLPEDD